jgi:hypothetical protein
MVETIKTLVCEKVKKIERECVSTGRECDILKELDSLHTNIILTTAFGK